VENTIRVYEDVLSKWRAVEAARANRDSTRSAQRATSLGLPAGAHVLDAPCGSGA